MHGTGAFSRFKLHHDCCHFISFLHLLYLEFGSCQSSWMEYGMSCYQINKDTKSHTYAASTCQLSGGDLINIDTNVEQAFISTKNKAKAWIGKYFEIRKATVPHCCN